MSDSNKAELLYVFNDAGDNTPANSPNWRPMRVSGTDGLTSTPNTSQSNESRTDTNRSDVVLTSRSSGGDVGGEFSADSWDEWLEAICRGTFTPAGVLINGQTARSATLLRRFNDLDNKHIEYRKIRANTFGITWAHGSITTTSLGLVGAGVSAREGAEATAENPIGTGSVLPAHVTAAMSGVDIQNISIAGITTGICVESGSLTLSANHRVKNCVANGADPTDNTGGSFNGGATLRVHNSDASFPLIALKNNQTALAFSYEMSDGVTGYRFEYPRCFMQFADPSNGGLDTDAFKDITLQAAFDEGIGGTVRITKFSV